MAELTAATAVRVPRGTAAKVREVQQRNGIPDYAGEFIDAKAVLAGETRLRAFTVGDEAVPTDGLWNADPVTSTVPDMMDTFRWQGTVKMYVDFDSGAGETVDVELFARDALGNWISIGTLTAVAHREEVASKEIGGRPVRFRLYNKTDDGDLHFAPAR